MPALPRTTVAVVLALGLATPALAVDSFNLRVLSAEADWTSVPDDATLRYVDWFADGNVQTGASYSAASGFVMPTPQYSVVGNPAAESTPGDYSIEGQALGTALFTRVSGSALAPITVNGVTSLDSQQRLRMNGATLNGSGVSLFSRNRRNFAASAGWDFAIPDAGTRYGLRFTDVAIGDTAFDDLISLDITTLASGTVAQMRRISGPDTSTLTISQSEVRTLESGLYSGYTLADVNFVGMHLYWSADSNQAWGDLELLNISDGGATITGIGAIAFNNRYSLFNGPDSFTRVQVGANWNTPLPAVPEPATWLMMLLGAAGLVGWRRRA